MTITTIITDIIERFRVGPDMCRPDGPANRSFRAAVVGDVNLTSEEEALVSLLPCSASRLV